MWMRHSKIILSALLSFSVILNGEYLGSVVLSNCQVKINISSWSLRGSCFVSSTSDQYKCYWISQQQKSKAILPSTFNKETNGDQDTGICSFNSSVPKQEGKYGYYIYSDPQPANPYSFDMLINGTDDDKIVKSDFWIENGVRFGKFTCNASSYFPDVQYIWSVPCQTESLTDGASVCSTSLKDQRTEVTCIAVYSTVVIAVDDDYSKEKILTLVLIGGGLGIGILSVTIGIAVYLKRRKGSQTTSELNDHTDHTDHTDETAAEISSAPISNSQQPSEDAGSYENVDNETEDHETAKAMTNSASTPLAKTIFLSKMNALGRPMTYT